MVGQDAACVEREVVKGEGSCGESEYAFRYQQKVCVGVFFLCAWKSKPVSSGLG